jgi:hypothetical protein
MDENGKTDEARKQTMLFAQLIEILTQNAIMMLGAMPDRSGRQRPPDLNGAEMMIEMLSVLHKKTKGNLSAEEERMISGTLYQLQSAFAEIASKTGDFGKARKATEAAQSAEAEDEIEEQEPDLTPPPTQPQSHGPTPHAQPPGQKPQGIKPAASTPGENKVKFSKKYE